MAETRRPASQLSASVSPRAAQGVSYAGAVSDKEREKI